MKYIPQLILTAAALLILITPAAAAAEYAIGAEITLSGTNYESDEIYLYIQGINVPLQEIPSFYGGYVTTPDAPVYVDENNHWKVSFTPANRFDAGTYTIFVTPVPLQYSTGHRVIKDDNLIQATKSIHLYGAHSSSPAQTVSTPPVQQVTAVQTPEPVYVPTTVQTQTPAPSPAPTETAKTSLPPLGILTGLIFAVSRR